MPYISGGGGGGGTVTGVTAADTSIVIAGTAAAPTVATGTLDVIAADHAPAADWSNNSHKITSLATGTAATDAMAFGQVNGTWRAEIQPWMLYTVTQGTWAITQNASVVGNAFLANTGAVNDELSYTLGLQAGTYSIGILYHQGTDRGITTTTFAGVNLGTFDGYNGSTTLNVIKSYTGAVVATAGSTTLDFKIASKNASSTNYRLLISAITLLRTA